MLETDVSGQLIVFVSLLEYRRMLSPKDSGSLWLSKEIERLRNGAGKKSFIWTFRLYG
jgi:hypothetical protein